MMTNNLLFSWVGVLKNFTSGARSAFRWEELADISTIRRRFFFCLPWKERAVHEISRLLSLENKRKTPLCSCKALSVTKTGHISSHSAYTCFTISFIYVKMKFWWGDWQMHRSLSLSLCFISLDVRQVIVCHVSSAPVDLVSALISGRRILPIIGVSETIAGIYSVQRVRQPPGVNSVTSPAG